MSLSRILNTAVLAICILPSGAMLGQQMHHMNMKSDTSKAKMERDHKDHRKPRVSKDSLIAEGKYKCCLKNPCDECYNDGENCECYKSVKKTGVVCKECYNGWQKGEGRVPGIKQEHVKAETENMESMDHHD